jgi:hypothetical protein
VRHGPLSLYVAVRFLCHCPSVFHVLFREHVSALVILWFFVNISWTAAIISFLKHLVAPPTTGASARPPHPPTLLVTYVQVLCKVMPLSHWTRLEIRDVGSLSVQSCLPGH